jgi:hypothetical protein
MPVAVGGVETPYFKGKYYKVEKIANKGGFKQDPLFSSIDRPDFNNILFCKTLFVNKRDKKIQDKLQGNINPVYC